MSFAADCQSENRKDDQLTDTSMIPTSHLIAYCNKNLQFELFIFIVPTNLESQWIGKDENSKFLPNCL